jgi:hypothetical protein
VAEHCHHHFSPDTGIFMSEKQGAPSGRRNPLRAASRLDDAPEFKQAVAKAAEYADRAAAAKDPELRDYYFRMHRKWLGIAEGWRLITDIEKSH